MPTRSDSTDLQDGSIRLEDLNPSLFDNSGSIPSLRTIGTGSLQAAAGNDRRFFQIFGSGHNIAKSSVRSTTTLILYQSALILTGTAASGSYRVQWASNVDTEKGAVLRLFNGILGEAVGSERNVAPTLDSIGTQQVWGCEHVSLSGSYEFRIEFKSNSIGKIAAVRDSQIEFWRLR